MARVTVEDCIDKINNRFELVVLATQRAKAITAGAKLTIDRDNDKNAVVALREIASKNIKPEFLREMAVKSLDGDMSVDHDDVIDENSQTQEENLSQGELSENPEIEETMEDENTFTDISEELSSDDFSADTIIFEDEDYMDDE